MPDAPPFQFSHLPPDLQHAFLSAGWTQEERHALCKGDFPLFNWAIEHTPHLVRRLMAFLPAAEMQRRVLFRGDTPLMQACWQRPELAHILLAGPVEREGVNVEEQSALLLACLHNPLLVPKLLAGGCSPNNTPAGRETPLMALIGKPWPGDAQIAQKALLDAGADPDAAVHNGNTALSWAIRYQANTSAIWQLLQAGASTSPVLLDEPEEDCLTLAFEHHGPALELLLRPVWGADTTLLKAFLADPKKCARINPDAQPVVAKFLAEEARIALDAALPSGHGADLGVASRPRL